MPVEFSELIEEQNATVGKGDFTGARFAAASRQRGRAGRMVRGAKWAPKIIIGTDRVMEILQCEQYQCFLRAQGRQDARETAG